MDSVAATGEALTIRVSFLVPRSDVEGKSERCYAGGSRKRYLVVAAPREAQWLATSRCRACDTSARDGQEQEITRETVRAVMGEASGIPFFFRPSSNKNWFITMLRYNVYPSGASAKGPFGAEAGGGRRAG